MKNQKGITLVSLVLYVVVMIIMLNVMSMISTQFYSNTESVQGNVEDIVRFNKFNNYFLKEVKSANNKVDSISNNSYILFSTGNSFSLVENAIYYNNIKICDGVESVEFKLEQDSEGESTIINTKLNFKKYSKSIRYKIENIY